MAMSEAARKAKTEYMRQWRKNNPDKVKAHRESYWERKGAEMLKQQQERENLGE